MDVLIQHVEINLIFGILTNGRRILNIEFKEKVKL
jgi:hypothetical protein